MEKRRIWRKKLDGKENEMEKKKESDGEGKEMEKGMRWRRE
jgi:hypothetical protein